MERPDARWGRLCENDKNGLKKQIKVFLKGQIKKFDGPIGEIFEFLLELDKKFWFF